MSTKLNLYQVSRKLTSCNVMLTVNKNPSVEKNQEIEVVMSVKGTTIRIKECSQDMYAPQQECSSN